MKLLVANRGEIAIRIARAARELGWSCVMVFSEDESDARHRFAGDEAFALRGRGALAYLNAENMVGAARETGCTFLHPGYGFLSENAALAAACAKADVRFVGPAPEVLRLLGDKSEARTAAERAGVPVPRGLAGPVSREEAAAFLASLGDGGRVMIKALHGGGGRGTRPAAHADELLEAFATCEAEARAAFGSADLYVEEFITGARHVEVQVAADSQGHIRHIFDRECTLQRNRQKLIEIAPSPSLTSPVREALFRASIDLAGAVGLEGVATMEFLVTGEGEKQRFMFMEANPRIQVEHTVSEEVADVDIVRTQLEIASGSSLDQCSGLTYQRPEPSGFAVQCRVNAEILREDGRAVPANGKLTRFELPTGRGIRIETHGEQGYAPDPAFDTLLAKLIVHERTPSYTAALRRAATALNEFTIAGCATNKAFLQALLVDDAVLGNRADINFIDENLSALLRNAERFETDVDSDTRPTGLSAERDREHDLAEGLTPITTDFPGTVAEVLMEAGQRVGRGQSVLLLEAMKMHHPVVAPTGGVLRKLMILKGDAVAPGQHLAILMNDDHGAAETTTQASVDPDFIRPDLAEVHGRHHGLTDEARPEAVEKRRAKGRRTARENIAELCDDGSFTEYGGLVLAAQRTRRTRDELIAASPADGLVAGFGSVNGGAGGEDGTRCAVLAYDYTVMAGTQGVLNHKKTDRFLDLAFRAQTPVVIFGEGGGGRPGDVDIRLGLDVPTFGSFAKLKRRVPTLSVVSGYCFAGNAALAGCADILIATSDASLGMGGPAMIEGGGLGRVAPDEIGPVSIQTKNGVIDVVAEDDAEAVAYAKLALSFFDGPKPPPPQKDQRPLRHVIPEDRKRVFPVRTIIETLCDEGSILELKKDYGTGIITALTRIGGRPVGLMANNNHVLSGAIDPEACEKAAGFLELCEARSLPVLSLCDTPGFMVGPDVEKRGQVRSACRLFAVGANLTVPFFAVVLRKAYGLGAQAMVAGSFHAPFFSVSWPTGEFGGMGLEGAVELGFRKELTALTDPETRAAFFQEKLDEYYEDGRAMTVAEFMEIDDVIDPADTRSWVLQGLATVGSAEKGQN